MVPTLEEKKELNLTKLNMLEAVDGHCPAAAPGIVSALLDVPESRTAAARPAGRALPARRLQGVQMSQNRRVLIMKV